MSKLSETIVGICIIIIVAQFLIISELVKTIQGYEDKPISTSKKLK